MYLYNKHYRFLSLCVDTETNVWCIEWAFWKDDKTYQMSIGSKARATMEFYRMKGVCQQ
jgi:hypothetical protein